MKIANATIFRPDNHRTSPNKSIWLWILLKPSSDRLPWSKQKNCIQQYAFAVALKFLMSIRFKWKTSPTTQLISKILEKFLSRFFQDGDWNLEWRVSVIILNSNETSACSNDIFCWGVRDWKVFKRNVSGWKFCVRCCFNLNWAVWAQHFSLLHSPLSSKPSIKRHD